MKKEATITIHHDFIVPIFRYALGRRTYVVSDTTNLIINLHKEGKIDKTNQELICKEITEAAKENNIGMEMDKKKWVEVLAELSSKN